MMALTENLQRSDLSFFEEAVAMQNLLLMTSMTQSELARMLSVSQPTLSNKLRLLKLSERERTLITENRLSERHARALLRLETERERMDLLIRVIDEGLSATETERIAEERQKKNAAKTRRCKADTQGRHTRYAVLLQHDRQSGQIAFGFRIFRRLAQNRKGR